MTRFRKRKVEATFVAETADGGAVAVLLDRPPLPIDGLVRGVVAYASPGTPVDVFAAALRELADRAAGSAGGC